MDATQAPAGVMRSKAPAGTLQAKNLDGLASGIAETQRVFHEIAKGSDHGPMTEQMEEVVRKIKKERAYYVQKAKNIMDTTQSYSARFEHELSTTDEALAKELGVTVAKYRGDEERDFVAKEFAVESFPSISVFKGGKMTKYTSEARDTASLKAFVEANM